MESRTARTQVLVAVGVLAALTFAGCSDASGAGSGVASPDGSVLFELVHSEDGALAYRVSLDDSVVVEGPLGLRTSTHNLTTGVEVGENQTTRIEERYTMPTGKQREREVVANEWTAQLVDPEGAPAELVVRAQDDGVGFRYRLLGSGSTEVVEESTGFAFPASDRALLRPYDSGDAGFIFAAGAYENPPELLALGEPTGATGFAFPGLFVGASAHVLVSEADLDATYAGTRLSGQPDGDLYAIRFPDDREGNGIGARLPSSNLPLTTPWRVLVVGDLATIVESTLVDDLSRPSVVQDPSWIQTGRAAWSWWSQGTGSPQLQAEYVDFAAEHGWEFVLVDVAWDQWEDAEQATRDLIDRAAEVGVDILLWYNSGGAHSPFPGQSPADRMDDREIRRAEMEKIAGWGASGIKIDFFNSDKQDRIAQYIGILEDAADFELSVNFHGATVPRGWQRTYPHLVTQEAVNGHEYYKPEINLLGDRALTPEMNVQLILSRNTVGSMDSTPVTFEIALAEKSIPYSHSLALSVLIESGIQHWGDRADSNSAAGYRRVFAEYPFVETLLSTVPTAWDETRLVDGSIDSHVILARRSEDTWYVAGIHASDDAAVYPIDLSFLENRVRHEAHWMTQGEDPDALSERTESLDAAAVPEVTIPPRGGFVLVLVPQSSTSDRLSDSP